jgi:stage IV sporulation protein FB
MKTPVRIHFLFWLLALGAVLTGQFAQLLTLFLIVIIHEFGHMVVARYYNWRITEMTILPFGGVVQIDSPGKEDPKEELLIALAGPMSNLFMIGIALLMGWFDIWKTEWVYFFTYGNAAIACFNLLPVYPLDGGRILQVFLSMIFPFRKAILVSLYSGICILLLLLSLSWFNIVLGVQLWIIIPYLFFMIFLEIKQLPYRFLKFLLARHSQRSRGIIFSTRYITAHPLFTMRMASEQMFRNRYHYFRVRDSVLKREKNYIYDEQKILAEIFDHKRPLRTFRELIKHES